MKVIGIVFVICIAALSVQGFRPTNFRDDDRCGPGYPGPNGLPAGCNPKRPFCSNFNFCGASGQHAFSTSSDVQGYQRVPAVPFQGFRGGSGGFAGGSGGFSGGSGGFGGGFSMGGICAVNPWLCSIHGRK